MKEEETTQPVPENHRSLLLIDDDAGLCSLMEEYFTQNGFHLECAYDGRSGLQRALEGSHDLVILDVMLPNLNGFEVLRQLRQRSHVPVVMLTARTQPQDRINGLESGADDYLPKPFEPGELLARIRAVLRRSHASGMISRTVLHAGDIELNISQRKLLKAGEAVDLTSVEFSILELLVRSAGRIVSRDEIAAALYQREATPYERSLDVHISHLRKKLESSGRTYIRTVRGSGYIFSAG